MFLAGLLEVNFSVSSRRRKNSRGEHNALRERSAITKVPKIFQFSQKRKLDWGNLTNIFVLSPSYNFYGSHGIQFLKSCKIFHA